MGNHNPPVNGFRRGFDPRRNTSGSGRRLTTLLKEALRKVGDFTDKDGNVIQDTPEGLLIKRVLKKAIEEGDKDMIKLIFNYSDGLPKIDVSVSRPVSDSMQEYEDDELRDIIAQAETLIEGREGEDSESEESESGTGEA